LPRAWILIADCKKQLGESAIAVEIYESVLEGFPDGDEREQEGNDVRIKLAAVYEELGQGDKASALIKEGGRLELFNTF
jgi:tetratricopeptide (TPR) repeat protein